MIGVGKVIKGWDEGTDLLLVPLKGCTDVSKLGVPQLSLGQKAILTCTPDFVSLFRRPYAHAVANMLRLIGLWSPRLPSNHSRRLNSQV